MSKVRAERHLSLQPHLEMHKKAFLKRVMLVAAYLPIFGLAAIFRIGSLALIFGSVLALFDICINMTYRLSIYRHF